MNIVCCDVRSVDPASKVLNRVFSNIYEVTSGFARFRVLEKSLPAWRTKLRSSKMSVMYHFFTPYFRLNMSQFYWSREATLNLIELYKPQLCLWGTV